MSQALTGTHDLMASLQSVYESARGPGRTLRGDDRIAEDLGIDSLQLMEMLASLEEQLRIEIVGDPRLFNVTTVDALVELLAHRVAGDQPRSED
jgi:acyl carrier protein